MLAREAEPALTKWTAVQPGEVEPQLKPEEFQGAWLVNQHAVGTSIVGVSSSALLLGGGGVTTRWSIDDVQALPDVPGVVRITARTGEMRQVAFPDPALAVMFSATVGAIRAARDRGQAFQALPYGRLTTLGELPGQHVTKVLGVVSEIVPASVLVAQVPGTSGLEQGSWSLRLQAQSLGANAIVGFAVQAFGTKGGLGAAEQTNVVLSGTAVQVTAQ